MRLLLSWIVFAVSSCAWGQDPKLVLDIRGTSLQELMNIKITSLTRKQQRIDSAPAAVYSITGDELWAMGVTHIAEALRYVPGVEVARIQAGMWAISMRGFNSRAANKLLVMVDGRSIYSTLYAGVLWEEKDLLLADVERIEVIRGPGGTAWGANAVNGVINIITKDAKDTLGAFVNVGAGMEESGLLQSRYGFELGEGTYARVYTKLTRRDLGGEAHSAGSEISDQNRMWQSGFRLDRHFEHNGHLTFQGDVYQGEIGHGYETLVPEGQEHNGGNLLLTWSSDLSNNIQQKWLLYYDKTTLKTSALVDRRETWNLDYQALYRWHTHEVVMGAGYRSIADDIGATPGFQLLPPERDDKVYSAFVQDDIALLTNKLHFIVGTKYERNDYSHEEWQPSVRASYAFEQALVWSAWSRAVRIPTRLEHDVVIAGLAGGRNLDPEYADVYELGWRYDNSGRWLLDISAYIGRYRDLLTIEPPTLGNEMSGDVKGFEVSFDMEPKPGWLLRVNYSHAEMDLSVSDSSLAVGSAEQIESLMPRNTAQISSLWNIDERWKLNTYIRYVDELPTQEVDSYWVADFTLAWRLNDKCQLQFVGRHLGDSEHHEWGGNSTAVEPDAALYISWGR